MEKCTGERELLCAVFEQARMDATGQRGFTLMMDARKWFNSEEYYPFSYIWICEQLQIDPTRVRRALSSIPKNNLSLNRSGAKRFPTFDWPRRGEEKVTPGIDFEKSESLLINSQLQIEE